MDQGKSIWGSIVDVVNGGFGEVVLILVVTLLGITSLQDVVVRFFGGGDRGIIGLLFPKQYKRKDVETIVASTVSRMAANGFAGNGTVSRKIKSDDDALVQLVALLAMCTKETGGNTFGQRTISRSDYYVDTMGAALDFRHRELIVALAVRLITRERRAMPAYLLAPKQGNPIVASLVASSMHACCFLAKGQREASRLDPITGRSLSADAALMNFEGVRLVPRDPLRERPFEGVAFDCNCSGGSTLAEAITAFNGSVPAGLKGSCEVQPIQDAFVLYRADVDFELDEMFKGHNLRVHRYLDLNEEAKGRLAQIGKVIAQCDGNLHHIQVVTACKGLVGWLRSHNLIKI